MKMGRGVKRPFLVGVVLALILANTILIFSRMGDVCRNQTFIGSQLLKSKQETIVEEFDDSRMYDERYNVFRGNPVLGSPRPNKGFLTIGIPTVQRDGGNYLLKTIDSLIRHTSDKEKLEVVVIVLLADLEAEFRRQMTSVLETAYQSYIADGFLQIIHIRPEFYPPLNHLERTFGDSERRVRWRSKQAVDFAFLMLYSSNVSEYYLQLEDDVISTPNFLTAMKEFIVRQTEPWVCLEFSHVGFIGKFYRSRHLRKLAMFMRNFYSEQPVDFLFRYFNVLMTQTTTVLRTPSLFHHIGTVSSLGEKNPVVRRPVASPLQDALPKVHGGDNPPADVSSTLKMFDDYPIELAYDRAAGHSWGPAPTAGQAVYIAFHEPVRLDRVIVDTGSPAHRDDFLQHGGLEASPRMVSRLDDGRVLCIDYVYLGAFVKGHIDVIDIWKRIPFAVHCLKIAVTQGQSSWLIIREIAVFGTSGPLSTSGVNT